jgi:antitoxin HicB
MVYHFKYFKEKNGYWAECIELKGCLSEGNTLNELKANLADALNLYLDEPSDSKMIFPLPKEKVRGGNILEIEVDTKVLCAMKIRESRLREGKTQVQVARELHYKTTSAYQKYERSKTCNPTLEQMVALKKVLPSFDTKCLFGGRQSLSASASAKRIGKKTTKIS